MFPSLTSRGLIVVALLFVLCPSASATEDARRWETRLDGRVRFYQTTELGVMVAGTDKSLYGVDSETGDVLWRRKGVRVDETGAAAVPGTDVLLLGIERDERTRLEALDLLTGETLWRSERVKGAPMQLAFDQDTNLLAVVLARDARSRPRENFKRKPVAHVFDLASGRELWKRELESEVEMSPAFWRDDDEEEVPFTLGNYRPPVFLDGRLYLFYEGVTSLDARTGRERRREKFRVNEEGLALTEADPLADERHIYFSGRGRVRAVSREDGEEVWESKDLGLAPEMILARGVIYVRTGGRFTRLKDGETVERGPFGVSAIDAATGEVVWRYKGADKGITNIVLPDPSTALIADRDDLIFIDASTGKRRAKVSHKIERAAFLILNERGEAIVGGRNEIAAFDPATGRALWRERHNAPGRGAFRTFAAIAARAASLYFRYGGHVGAAFRGAQMLNAVGSLRWSGIAGHANARNLTSLAADYGRERVRERLTTFGALSRARERYDDLSRLRRAEIARPSVDVDGGESLLARLDPASQLERLSRHLWRRRRLASLRGQWMYFYTELRGGGNGLAGVNVNTGETERAVRLNDPDERFISDEATGLLYSAKGNRLVAYALNAR